MDYRYKDFFNRLQFAKAEKKMRVEDISKTSGVPVGTLAKIFAGITTDPKINTVIAIAYALGVSVDYLIYGNPYGENYSNIEKELIQKYRQLDADGKERVDYVLNMECKMAQERIEDKEKRLG